MEKIYTSASQLIGRTPLLELTRLEKQEGLRARVLAKLEYLNPAGSAKDRCKKWTQKTKIWKLYLILSKFCRK